MALTVLQFDFPFAGPWGEAKTPALEDHARDIATEPGLVFKLWTENEAEGIAGGIYAFRTAEEADAYRRKHTARLAESGVTDIRVLTLTVNEALSRITHAPV